MLRHLIGSIVFATMIIQVVFVSCIMTAYAEEPRPLRIGLIQSLTGIAAEYGKRVQRGADLARQQINESGRQEVELIVEDDQSDAKNSLSAYRKLRNQTVDIILGPTWAFTANTLFPLAGRDHQILFSVSVLPESVNLKDAAGYGFVNFMSTRKLVEPFSAFLSNMHPRNVVIVYTNNSFGEAQLAAYREILDAHKVQILDVIPSVTQDENDWSPVLPKVKQWNPSLILLLLNKSDIEMFLRRATELQLSAQIFASHNAFDAYRLSQTKNLFNGLCLPYPYQQLRSDPHFFQAYHEKFGEEPLISADYSYDAVRLVHSAFQNAAREHLSLRTALEKASIRGVAGVYRFDPLTSFSVGQSSLLCIHDGEVVINMVEQ